ncbi:isoaspartyl peptidase/L-asparaginase [Hymenobacter sp. YC55]|uniref:isoaspartyl peptidase/L-asparaginase family protein n=1 Tax=Hymenobacter sp. YC55 TaxID=3034019 RepID=UPI0023F8A033|nr:isoaspartyl peptidase/L-asparaginase [Hymenobacter sp. YC55]MDF7814767.1 isoaspartyl peptidase/L-asparaginase [Hymenobacter sp. YC55]
MPLTSSLPCTLLLHGGSGRLHPAGTPFPQQTAYTDALTEAAQAGYAVLSKGGTSVEAVEASLRILEDSPLFNAGRGSVFSHAGVNEMDAALMDGATLRAGAVAGVRTVRNPISAARAVMERSSHVLLTGAGADEFAAEMGLATAAPEWFRVEARWQQWQALQQAEALAQAPSPSNLSTPKYGTVGAVALDQAGHLAAGTSTGGMLNKKYGRVGDSPLIGAGTYANHVCAVSGTGHGEFFIRHAVAHDIAALTEYRGLSVQQAAELVIHHKVAPAGGRGGVIVLDAQGNVAMPYSTEGMFWALVRADGRVETNICNMVIE